VHHQQYADDTQLYLAFNGTQSVLQLQECLRHLNYWLSLNGLCLNPDKTEFVVFGTSQKLRTLPSFPDLEIAGHIVPPSETIKTLGVTLDKNLSLNQHVSAIYKSSFYHIRAIRHIRASLSNDVCITLATSLVQSRLDYANAILQGLK